MMKKMAFIAVLAMLMTGALSAQDSKTVPAQRAAESWLALVDKGDYAASYDQAASMFKEQVTKDGWVHMVKAVQAPLGAVVSRKLQSAQFTTTMPGAPDGQYVVIQYNTSFENKQSAVETVVPMLDKDRQWRVSGYFIK
jgi:Protein of unknown function (DUF4019)